jgi:hypothetical protein
MLSAIQIHDPMSRRESVLKDKGDSQRFPAIFSDFQGCDPCTRVATPTATLPLDKRVVLQTFSAMGS